MPSAMRVSRPTGSRGFMTIVWCGRCVGSSTPRARAGVCGTGGREAEIRAGAARRYWMKLVSTTVRSEEHTSELQSLMRISYAVFCLKKKKKQQYTHTTTTKERK